MLDQIYENHVSASRNLPLEKYRYLYNNINFDQRLLSIIGPRGTGKTILLLQYLYNTYNDPTVGLYISADHIHVAVHGLYEIAQEHVQNGGKHLCIDEIHKYVNWAQEVKNIHDTFTELKVAISGSSALQIKTKGYDLSRRLILHTLRGLSLREFIEFKTNKRFSPFSIDDIRQNHQAIAQEITQEIKILPVFRKYLISGYYPFFLEGAEEYETQLHNIINKILYEDLPASFPIKHSNITQLKRFLYMLATSEPFQVNISHLSRELGMARESLYQYLDYLTGSFVLHQIWKKASGRAYQRKPAKVYFENSNLLLAITPLQLRQVIGTVRETFFVNQVSSATDLYVMNGADFITQEGIQFEVGGKGKSPGQLTPETPGYLAIDDIEVGFQKRIPLYLFGFLY